jgi:methionyl-tRNA formyltransferase
MASTMTRSRQWIVLFGGAGREACIERMLAEGVQLEAIVVPALRNARLEQSVARLRALPCKLVEVERAGLAGALHPWAGKSILSIGFPYLIPVELLALFKPALNLHPTLLPRYRGPTTAAFILLNNETESGSTVHHMTAEMDRGDIVVQSRMPLTAFDTIRSMQRKVYASEAQLVMDALAALENDAPAQPQDESQASEFPKKRTSADSEIDPSLPLTALFNQIRACDPNDFPAFFYHNGEKVCIRLWRPGKDAGAEDEI